MKLARRMLAAGLMGRKQTAPPPEQHYLQFTAASSDYAYATGVLAGYTDAVALLIKVAGRPDAADGTFPHPFIAQRSDVANDLGTLCLDSYINATANQHFWQGFTAAGAGNFASGAFTTGDVAQVRSMAHDLAGNAVECRAIACADGAVLATYSAGSVADRDPDSIVLAGYITTWPTVVVGNSYCDLKLVSVLALKVMPSDADIGAWAQGGDARAVWDEATEIIGYWVASSISGATLPALVGADPITLVGPTAADLVAL